VQETLTVRTRKAQEVVDITGQVAEVLRRSGLTEGLCTVFVRHATAAIVINENADPGFRADLLTALDRLFPPGIWEHDKVDDNGAAHLKAAFLGPSEAVPVRAGRLLLGTWQGIALVECDGPREREIVVDLR
jgi:secondary thiamine-phosphate synthase enzyme